MEEQLKLYHCLPNKYYSAQLQNNSFVAHNQQLWCCDNAEGTVEAQQQHTDDLIVVCIDATNLNYTEIVEEDAELQSLTESVWGRVYTLNEMVIPANLIQIKG